MTISLKWLTSMNRRVALSGVRGVEVGGGLEMHLPIRCTGRELQGWSSRGSRFLSAGGTPHVELSSAWMGRKRI
jgi:hypothetical protein